MSNDITFRREEPPSMTEEEVAAEQQKSGRKGGRQVGTWNVDPLAASRNKGRIVTVRMDIQYRRKFDWIIKYFQLKTFSGALKFCLNMTFELMVAHEKGYELYMERKIGKQIYRRRIVIE